MSGVETRAKIDTETVRALLLINGGGVVALLTLLPRLLEDDSYHYLVQATLVGILLLILGLVSAVVHNKFRRDCSLIFERHKMEPPGGTIFGWRLERPRSCFISSVFMWCSVACFISAGSTIAVVGLIYL
jgi:hypothetical protein